MSRLLVLQKMVKIMSFNIPTPIGLANLMPTHPYTAQTVSIHPISMHDVDLILEMHKRLSQDSLYRRYHRVRLPSRAEVTQICELDGVRGRAVVATASSTATAVIGLAYYILSSPDIAETAFVVEDMYQGQGVGKQLMHALKQQAINDGVRFFDAYILPSNLSMIHLLNHAGEIVYNHLSYGTREFRVQLS